MTTYAFIDDSGETRLVGTIVPPPGGSAPTSREEWSGNAVAIDDDGGAWLTWDTSAGPDSVLDNSIPAHPTIAVAGVYLVSVVVTPATVHSGGYYDAGLHLDRTGFNASMYAYSSQGETVNETGRVSDLTLSFAWYIPEDGEIGVFCDLHTNGGFAASAAISYAHIQRLS